MPAETKKPLHDLLNRLRKDGPNTAKDNRGMQVSSDHDGLDCAKSPTPLVSRDAIQAFARRHRWMSVSARILLIFLAVSCIAVLVCQWLHLGTNEAVQIMPDNTRVLLSISPPPLQLGKLYGIQATSSAFGVTAQHIKTTLLEGMARELNLNVEKDILPWLGFEAVAAILENDRSGTEVLIALAVRNSAGASGFTQKVRDQLESKGRYFEEEDYHNVRVVYQRTRFSDSTLAFAQINHFLVIGSSVNALHRAVDTAQGRHKSLGRNVQYRKILSQLQGDRIGYIYVDGASLTAPFTSWEALARIATNGLQSAGASITLNGLGIRFNSLLMYDPDALTIAQDQAMQLPTNPNRILSVVPSNAVFFANGQQFGSRFDQLLAASDASGENILWRIRDMESSLDIDLQRDLFQWADGEYALGLLENPAGLFGDAAIPFDLIAIIETHNLDAARQGLQHITDAVATQAGTKSVDVIIGGELFRVSNDTSGRLTFGYGSVEGFVVIGSSKEALEVVAEAAKSPLARSATFSALATQLPTSNTGYAYLNVDRLMEALYLQIPVSQRKMFDEQFRPYIDWIRAIAEADDTATGQRGEVRSSVFVLLNSQPRE
ncbi:MAG: DUF3352 domain-containing protein [Chloroflexi bacterium]|nr:DUF3352 domain-containing protein [Chloroflexota bacterium]